MKKRTLIILLSVAVIAAVTVGATLAYFSDTDDATNTFTVGNVAIELSEPGWDEQGSVDADTVYPGEPLKKDPTVKNVGANPCLVRIKVDWPELPDGVSPITYKTNYVPGALGEHWHQDGDYYYYLMPLDLAGSTNPLFHQVVMPTDLENGNGTTEYDIVVTAEAVQAQGVFARFADMADGISLTNPPTYGSQTEFLLVKQMFFNAFGH